MKEKMDGINLSGRESPGLKALLRENHRNSLLSRGVERE